MRSYWDALRDFFAGSGIEVIGMDEEYDSFFVLQNKNADTLDVSACPQWDEAVLTLSFTKQA